MPSNNISYALFWLAKVNASCCQTKYANTHKQIILILHVHELPSQCSLSEVNGALDPLFVSAALVFLLPLYNQWHSGIQWPGSNWSASFPEILDQGSYKVHWYSIWWWENSVILQSSLVTSPSSGMSGVISLWLKSDPQGSILPGKIAAGHSAFSQPATKL